MSRKMVTIHKSRSVGFSWADPIVRRALDRKPGIAQSCGAARGLAFLLVAMLAAAIVIVVAVVELVSAIF